MPRKPILFVGTNYAPILTDLEARFDVFNLRDAADRDATIAQAAPHARAIFSNEKSWTPDLIDALPKLEVIALASTGYDNIDLAKARDRGIRVTNAPGAAAEDVADMAMVLLVGTARRVTWYERYLRSGSWISVGRAPMANRIYGKKLGILGLGAIGRAVARRAEGFSMDIAYYGRGRKDDVPYRYYDDLKAMASDVDFLMVSCSAGPETNGIINAEIIEALGPSGILVNVARGVCVDEAALLDALRNERLLGAGLDVYEEDPNDGSRYEGIENAVLTPHVGSGTVEARKGMNDAAIDNLEAFFAGRPLPSPVPETPNRLEPETAA